MIKIVMEGKDEGADNSSSDEENTTGSGVSSGIAGRVSSITLNRWITLYNNLKLK